MRFGYAWVGDRQAPIIPIQVRGRRRWHTILTYVDSGASCSILRPEEAKRLGVADLLPRRVSIATSGGRTMEIKLYRMAARIGTWQRVVTFGVPQGFDLQFNLLGRKDVFEHFTITFHDRAGAITFVPDRPGR